MSAYYLTDAEAGMLTITGGVSGLGQPANTVSVDELIMFDPSLATCGLEPAGTIGIRGADGNWFDIVFDGMAEFGVELDDPSACDGCGGVYWRGEYLGEVCPSMDALVGWEGRPW